jgi:hypothetical protein
MEQTFEMSWTYDLRRGFFVDGEATLLPDEGRVLTLK